MDGRSSWDQVAVLSVVRPELFRVESSGRLERRPDGQVVWNPARDDPIHHLVTPRPSTEEMARIIEGLMARPPRKAGSVRAEGAGRR